MVGIIIIATSYLLEPLQDLLDRRKKTVGYASLEWATTESLQLQRAAYQGIGSGTWTGHLDAIPVTKSDELMGDLPHVYDSQPGSSIAVQAYDSGLGSSIVVQAHLGLEELKPAPMPCRLTASDKASNDPNAPAEDNRHCTNRTEQMIPRVSRDNTHQSADSFKPDYISKPKDACGPPLAVTSPPRQQIEPPELRELRAGIATQPETASERQMGAQSSLESV